MAQVIPSALSFKICALEYDKEKYQIIMRLTSIIMNLDGNIKFKCYFVIFHF